MNKIKDLITKYQEIIIYLIVGGITTVIALGVYYLCTYTFLNPQIPLQLQLSNIISWTVGVLFAYLMNRKYVFKSKTKSQEKIKEFKSFLLARITTLIVDMLMMYLLVSILNFNDKIIKLIVQIVVIILNYLFSKLMVFKKQNS